VRVFIFIRGEGKSENFYIYEVEEESMGKRNFLFGVKT